MFTMTIFWNGPSSEGTEHFYSDVTDALYRRRSCARRGIPCGAILDADGYIVPSVAF